MTNPLPWGMPQQVDPNGSLPDIIAEYEAGRALLTRSNVLTRCPAGGVSENASTYGGYCTHIEAELAGRAIGVQIGMPNISSTQPVVAARFAFADALGDLNTASSRAPELTYTSVTWGGAATGTLPVGAAARPAWLWSDVMPAAAPERTDGAGSVIHVELRSGVDPGDSQNWFTGLYAATETNEAVVQRKWRGYRSTASAALGSATFSGSALTGHLVCAIRYVCMETGIPLLTIGESHDNGTTVAGTANAGGVGYAEYAAVAMTAALGYPVEHCNLGWQAQDAPTYTNRLVDVASSFAGSVLLYAASSTNSMDEPITAANITEMRGELGRALAVAAANRMYPILRCSLQSNAPEVDGGSGGSNAKAFAGGDPLRVAYDAELAASGMVVWQPTSIFSGDAVASGNAAGQIEWVQAYTTDGVHANDAGYALGGALLRATLESLLP